MDIECFGWYFLLGVGVNMVDFVGRDEVFKFDVFDFNDFVVFFGFEIGCFCVESNLMFRYVLVLVCYWSLEQCLYFNGFLKLLEFFFGIDWVGFYKL